MTSAPQRSELLSLIRDAFTRVGRHELCVRTPLAYSNSQRVRLLDEGKWEIDNDFGPSVRGAFSMAVDALLRDGELADAVDALKAFAGLQAYASRFSSPNPNADQLGFAAQRLLKLLLCHVCAPNALVVDEERWEQATSEVWDLLSDGLAEFRLLMPLYGPSVSDAVHLGELTLRPLTARERTRYLDMSRGLSGPVTCQCGIEYRDRRPLAAHGADSEVETQKLFDAARALRIWCPFRIQPAHVEEQRMCFGHWSASIGNSPPRIHRPEGMPDIDGFQRFWTSARDVLARPPQGLDVALSRYELMQDWPRNSDRVLDQMIALEALFLKREERQELGYRLRMRIAHFAGDTKAERVAVEKLAKKAYSLRSKIAHGEAVQQSDREVQHQLDELVRAVLIRYCHRATADREDGLQKRICNELDTHLLDRRHDLDN